MAPTWPNFFIAGAPRAATTSLWHYLDPHPDIFLAPVKEPHFFSDSRDRTWTDGGPVPAAERAYLRLFRGARGHGAVGEASTTYMDQAPVAARIASKVPDARIILILRDPVKRAHSHYLMSTRGGAYTEPMLDFLDALDTDEAGWEERHGFIRASLYARHVKRFMGTFGQDRVHVVTTHQLTEDPRGLLRGVAEFLGVDPEPMDAVDTSLTFNETGRARNPVFRAVRDSEAVRRVARRLVPVRARQWVDRRLLVRGEPKPQLDPRAAARLQELFAPDVAALEELLGRDLPELTAAWA